MPPVASADRINALPPDARGAAVDEALDEAGVRGVRKERQESREALYCPDGYEYRTCYWVEHGDGTKSDEWCTGWGCR